jgi:adenosylcobyric acid synthase
MEALSDPVQARARAIMVVGTTSHAGKSTVAAALCRILARQGFRVAPFKAQNMSNNSWVTPQGAEIGRAQAMQARAAGIEPHADMNPLLLKPSGGNVMQVVALGKSIGNMTGKEYYARIGEMRALVHAAYDRLAARFDIIVLEGAGSPAEINLRDRDLVNMAMAEYAGARCVLIADIERGGVFASILGTVSLLEDRHRPLLSGILINKFRGDASLLDPGIAEIEALTRVPVLGVLPFLADLGLEEEDSLGVRDSLPQGPVFLDIAVIRFPHISNFTDFQPFEAHRPDGVRVRFVADPRELGNPDFIILPGSKNVMSDAGFLRSTRLDRALTAAPARGIPVFGICGGFQMLGRVIRDPFGLEREGLERKGLERSDNPDGVFETDGLGLLPLETVLERNKILNRVEARNIALPFISGDPVFHGYEIHQGRTHAAGPDRPALRVIGRNGNAHAGIDGYVADNGMVSGCYLHGLFESPDIRGSLFRWLLLRKGMDPKAHTEHKEAAVSGAAASAPEDPLDRIADTVLARFNPVSLLQ